MPRPREIRKINFFPEVTYFKPRGVPLRDIKIIELTVEEVEALRLKNIKQYNQNQCALKMKTSQSTFQRIITSAHQKLSKAIIEGSAIKIIK